MSKVFVTFVFVCLAVFGFAQQVCELAVEIEEPQNFCSDYSFDNAVYSEPSTSCNPLASPGNIWFSFIADGENVVINANHESGVKVYFSIIQFTTIDCDENKYVEIACAENSLIAPGILEEGVEYYVLFEVEDNQGGIAEICIHSQHDTPPPSNDVACDAIELGITNFCISGTTQYAESHQDSFPCGTDFVQDVWYKFELDDNLAFGAEIEIIPEIANAEFQVKLVQFTFDTCNTEYVTRMIDCDGTDGYNLLSSTLEKDITYYIVVSSKSDDESNFDLCINELIADNNTLICFPEIITVNGESIEVDLFNTLFTSDLPGCDYSNKLKYYQFDSGTELETVEIEVDSLGNESEVFIGIGYHENNTCLQDFMWVDQFCGDVSIARLVVENLMPNTEYVIAIGNNASTTDKFELTINGDYPNPFYNASPCTAYELIPGQSCIGGTNAVGGSAPGNIPCETSAIQTENWYKIKRSAFNNPEVFFENFMPSENYYFTIGYFPSGCTNDLVILNEMCAANDGFSQSLEIPDSIDFVYLAAIFSDDLTRNFRVCIDYQDAPAICNTNDFCQEAIHIGMLSTQQETCFEACSYNATIENTNIPVLNEFPSVWYSFEVDQESTINLTFEEAYDARYYISLASSNDCNTFIIHDIKYAFVNDDSFLRFNVPSSGTFFLIVSSMEDEGGYVNLCVTQESINACATDDKLRVTGTSMGSSFSGPFKPQEVVSFCYDLPAYQPGELTDCQWIQGVVPSFGMGWNNASFDSLGMPVQSSIIQSINQNISWDWFNDINANVDNDNIFLSFNQRAMLDLCHSTESHCDGSSLVNGDLLPPGWFAFNTGTNDPESSGGDGINCQNSQGPWQICFDLIADDSGDHDISIFTFADGLIADDSFVNDFCLNDYPENQMYFVDCQNNPVDTSVTIATCDDLPTVIFNNNNSRYFWTTTVDPAIENNTSGNGTSLEVSLKNLTDVIVPVQYSIQEYNEFGCLLKNIDLTINVYPSIFIPRPVTTDICLTDSIPMNEIVDLSEFVLGAYAVDWNSENVLNNPTAYWLGSEDETIHYTVVSQVGCTFQDTFIIDIENVIVEDYVMEQTICKDVILDFHEALPLTEIIEDSFAVNWEYEGLEDSPFVQASFEESTLIPFEITGERGCVYRDTLDIYVPFIDLSSDIDDKLCSTDEILLSASFSSDIVDDFFWLTPKDEVIESNNISVPSSDFDMGLNVFEFTVNSIENCQFVIKDSVTLFEVPIVDLEDITDVESICSYEEVSVHASVTPAVYSTSWNTPEGILDTSFFKTSTAGTYIYTAGYEDEDISCLAIDSFIVEVHPDVVISSDIEEKLCSNDEIVLNANFSNDLASDFFWLTPKDQIIEENDFSLPSSDFDMGLNVFEFTVNSVNNCQFTIKDSVTLFEVPIVELQDLTDSVGICSYEEVTFDATVSPEIYNTSWETPDGFLETSFFKTSTAGNYIYTAGYSDDDISCLTIDTIVVEVYPDVETSFEYDTLICFNDTTEIISQDPNFKFVWSTGSNGSKISATPGIYSVTVSNDFECQEDYSFEIKERALPAPLFSYDVSICEGDSTSIVGLDPQYNYSWNSGNTQDTEVSFGGTHSVTVTDDIMCADTFEFMVDVLVYPEVQLAYEIIQDTLFLMNLTEGEFECSYVLDDTVIPMAGDTFLVLENGDYTLSLQCNNEGCFESETAEFSIIIDGVEPQRISSVKLYPNPNNGVFTLKYEGEIMRKIELFSMEGKLIQTNVVNQADVYMHRSNLTPGTYWLRCTMDNQIVTKKLIVI